MLVVAYYFNSISNSMSVFWYRCCLEQKKIFASRAKVFC